MRVLSFGSPIRPRSTHPPVGPFRCGRMGHPASATRSCHKPKCVCISHGARRATRRCTRHGPAALRSWRVAVWPAWLPLGVPRRCWVVRVSADPLDLHTSDTLSFQCPDSPSLGGQRGLELDTRCLGETLPPTLTSSSSVAGCGRPASPRCRVNPLSFRSVSHQSWLLAHPNGRKCQLTLDRTAGRAIGSAHLGGSQGDGEGGA